MAEEEQKDTVGAVLVVGGGIAGMQASLDLAESGYRVYLADKSPSIGGVMAQLDKTFPTNDCSMCIMAPKLVATGRHHNIHLKTFSQIEKVEGEAGNFTVTIRSRARRINPDKCTGCGDCAQHCPIETVSDYNERLTPRRAVYVKYPQAVPLVYSIDKDLCIGCGICEQECKAGAIEYAQEDVVEALKVGSVILCPGFDEFEPEVKKEYGYGEYKNVLSSIEFERLLSATGPHAGTVLRPSDGDIPAKVAFLQCVGSRDDKTNRFCSSVCCMYAMKEAVIAQEHTHGLSSHIFFMDLRAFGKEFDDYYIKAQEEHEIAFTRCRVSHIEEDAETKDLILTYVEGGEVRQDRFNMVVLSVGLCPPNDAHQLADTFGIELNHYNFCKTNYFSPLETTRDGVFVAGAFSAPKDIPTTVAEASGAAGKAGRILSKQRNTLVTVKEYPEERDIADEEARVGVFVCHCGINIGGVVDVPAVMDYADSLPSVAYAERNLYTCSQDTQDRIREKIEEHGLNRVIVASCTPRTHEPLFQDTLREAGLNPYLFEMANIRDQCSWIHMHEPKKATQKAKDLVRMAVAKARLIEPLAKAEIEIEPSALVIGGGIAGMTAALDLADQDYHVHIVEREDELGGYLRNIHYVLGDDDPQQLLRETVVAVEGHPNITVHKSAEIKDIEGYVGNFETTVVEDDGTERSFEHGIVIVANGGIEYTPTEYHYGKNPKVLTQSELEQLLAKGEALEGNIVMIQCVGCRNEERTYCSRVCCGDAVKNTLKLKELNPDVNVYIVNRDIRTYGFREDFYSDALEQGLKIIRYDDENMPEVTEDLNVTLHDDILDDDLTIDADWLVLSAAILPQPDNEEIMQMLKIPLSKDGFFLEAHMKLRPVDFATEGVFLAGTAHSPKYIDEAMAQASGAAARAVTILSKGVLDSEGIIAMVNENLCDGCGICEPICEYKAIEIEADPKDPEKKLAVVNEGLCKGCGACVAACPSGAMEQRGYKDDQLYAMIDAALEVEEE